MKNSINCCDLVHESPHAQSKTFQIIEKNDSGRLFLCCCCATNNVGVVFPSNKDATGRVHHRKHMFISGLAAE